MQIYTLFSSSSGNCTYIKDGATELLIDAGVSCKNISDALRCLDTGLDRIDAILITHEHSDHIRGLGVISARYAIPIYVTYPSARAICESRLFGKASRGVPQAESIAKNIRITEPDLSYGIGDLTVSLFPTPHDARSSVGFVIEDSRGDSFGFATDIGHVSDRVAASLRGVRHVLVESNHDEGLLRQSGYPQSTKERILSDYGHLSNADCSDFVTWLIQNGTENITLAHLSRENNRPEIAYRTTRAKLLENDIACGADCLLSVAGEKEITKVLC